MIFGGDFGTGFYLGLNASREYWNAWEGLAVVGASGVIEKAIETRKQTEKGKKHKQGILRCTNREKSMETPFNEMSSSSCTSFCLVIEFDTSIHKMLLHNLSGMKISRKTHHFCNSDHFE